MSYTYPFKVGGIEESYTYPFKVDRIGVHNTVLWTPGSWIYPQSVDFWDRKLSVDGSSILILTEFLNI